MKDIYLALAGAMGQEQRMSQIANNLSNVNTVGFKKDGSVFLDYFKAAQAEAQAAGATTLPENPSDHVWPTEARMFIDFTHGDARETGRPLDAALAGDGFFMVQVEGDVRSFYTRAGNFQVNVNGDLVTPLGHRVLDNRGTPIQINVNESEPRISGDGTIFVGEVVAAKLGVARFDQPAVLIKYGEGLFTVPGGVPHQIVNDPDVRPGMLEGSNVSPVEEMIQMIQVQRAYETQQKVMQTIDELFERRLQSASQ